MAIGAAYPMMMALIVSVSWVNRIQFLIELGTKWVYRSNDVEEVHQVHESNLSIDCRIALITITRTINDIGLLRFFSGMTVLDEYRIASDRTGLFRLADRQRQLPKTEFGRQGCTCLLKEPLTVGNKWNTYTYSWFPRTGTMAITGRETIKVPAGTFYTTKVETQYRNRDNSEIKAKWWYSPDVGLVKEEIGNRKTELSSFLRGKK